jgi:hypothetical protein
MTPDVLIRQAYKALDRADKDATGKADPQHLTLFGRALGFDPTTLRVSKPTLDVLDILSKADMLTTPKDPDDKTKFDSDLSSCSHALLNAWYGTSTQQIATVDARLQAADGKSASRGMYILLNDFLNQAPAPVASNFSDFCKANFADYMTKNPASKLNLADACSDSYLSAAPLEIFRASYSEDPGKIAGVVHILNAGN